MKIWLENHVDFNKPANQFTAATALVIGVANFVWDAGNGVSFNGIALGTIAAIVIYHLMTAISRWRGTDSPEPEPAHPAP